MRAKIKGNVHDKYFVSFCAVLLGISDNDSKGKHSFHVSVIESSQVQRAWISSCAVGHLSAVQMHSTLEKQYSIHRDIIFLGLSLESISSLEIILHLHSEHNTLDRPWENFQSHRLS
jgi:hypothetical protein